jgi:hypothetical protein
MTKPQYSVGFRHGWSPENRREQLPPDLVRKFCPGCRQLAAQESEANQACYEFELPPGLPVSVLTSFKRYEDRIAQEARDRNLALPGTAKEAEALARVDELHEKERSATISAVLDAQARHAANGRRGRAAR